MFKTQNQKSTLFQSIRVVIDLSLSLIIAGWGQILNILWFASAQCLKTDRFRGLSEFTTWMCALKQINTDAYEVVSFLTRLLLDWHCFLRRGSGRLFSPRNHCSYHWKHCGNTTMSDRLKYLSDVFSYRKYQQCCQNCI